MGRRVEKLEERMQKTFGQSPQICPFSSVENAEEGIDEILKTALKTQTFSNEEIVNVQNMIDVEVGKQKNKGVYPANFEQYQVNVTKTRSVPVTKTRQVAYTDHKIVRTRHEIRQTTRFLGIKTGSRVAGHYWSEHAVPFTNYRQETYVEYKTESYQDPEPRFRLKYDESEIFRKAKLVVYQKIKCKH